MQFSKIINQHEVKQQLVELIQHNRLSHALLFLSKEGSGALSLALALAHTLLVKRQIPKNKFQIPMPHYLVENSRLTTHNSRLKPIPAALVHPAQKQTNSFILIFIFLTL